MEDINKRTLASYEAAAEDYIRNTAERGIDIEYWIRKSLHDLSFEANILEIGSASGIDAKFIEEQGYRVEKTDATEKFVSILQRDDPSAHALNVITDEIPGTYDLILANAVLLHFTEKDAEIAVQKIHDALNAKGVFALTLKEGVGEFWQENKEMPPRFFRYWTKESITEFLRTVGFADIDVWAVSANKFNASWLMIIAKKA